MCKLSKRSTHRCDVIDQHIALARLYVSSKSGARIEAFHWVCASMEHLRYLHDVIVHHPVGEEAKCCCKHLWYGIIALGFLRVRGDKDQAGIKVLPHVSEKGYAELDYKSGCGIPVPTLGFAIGWVCL